MKDFIKQYKEKYYSIGFIICSKLGNEKVYFNNHGFNHLIRKKGVPRPNGEQKRRLNLIENVSTVIKKGKISSFKKIHLKGKLIRYWSIKNKSIVVILRKINRGKLHFYSVFDDR